MMLTLLILLFTLPLTLLTIIDWRSGYLPDELSFTLLVSGLLLNRANILTPFIFALLGAIIGFLLLWGLNLLFKHWRQHDCLGMGDAKLLAAIGAWLGWQSLPYVLLISAGITLVITWMRLGKNTFLTTKIPYGPGLAVAGIVMLLSILANMLLL